MFVTPAFAQAAGGSGGNLDFLTSMMPLVLIFAVFYFLLIRPQQKKAKTHRDMVAAVRRGDAVVTGGGIHGKVTKVIDDATVQVEIHEGVRVKVVKATLTEVRSKGEPARAPAGGDGKGGGGEQKGGLLSKLFK